MSRPVDWAPLATADPVPGDETEIRFMANRYRDFAAELEAQAATLNRLAQADGWDACAGRQFASTASEVAGEIQKAKGRYQAVGEALNSYVGTLVDAQVEADAALREAQRTEQRLSSEPAPATPAPPLEEALDGPRRRLNHAVSRRDAAAHQAASRIREATRNDGLKDGWWDKVKNRTSKQWDKFIDWVHKHADAINGFADVLGWISTALAAVAICLSFIPVVNAAVPFLLGAAAVLTAVSLVCHVLTALSGDGSWVAVAFDVVGLVTFGYGKVAAKGAQAGEQALKVAASRAARKAAEKSVKQAARAAATGTRQQAGRVSAAARQAAKKQVRKAAKNLSQRDVGNAMRTKAGTAVKALVMDGEAAAQAARAKALAGLAPTSARAQAAAAQVSKNIRNAAIAGAGGIVADVADKAKIAGPIEKHFTFGRYAGK